MNKIKKSMIGKIGEDIACQYLKQKGYKIIERNHRQPWGEIDIIVKDNKGVLVFVEVKTMLDKNYFELKPEDNLTNAKLDKLKRTASVYVNQNEKLLSNKKGVQIDLIAILIPFNLDLTQPLTNIIKNCSMNHYKNI